jgi:hypothetical protein
VHKKGKAAKFIAIYCQYTPGWGLNARLMTLLCKTIIIAKSKEVKTRYNLAVV